jgi:hypothetical protein
LSVFTTYPNFLSHPLITTPDFDMITAYSYLLGRHMSDAALKQKITQFANADGEFGWVKTQVDGKPYKFPKRALMWYIFGNSSPIIPLLPKYTPICGHGYKMQGDNPYHSDAWLGGGLCLDKAYKREGAEPQDLQAFSQAKDLVEDEMQDIISFDFTVLANGLKNITSANLSVYEALKTLPPNSTSSSHILCQESKPRSRYFPQLNAICLPHAGMEFDLVAQKADVIICETGGKLAHLAIVSREQGKLLIRVDNACKRFPVFTKLDIDLNQLTLKADYD